MRFIILTVIAVLCMFESNKLKKNRARTSYASRDARRYRSHHVELGS